MCNKNYQGFIESVSELLKVKSDAAKLKVTWWQASSLIYNSMILLATDTGDKLSHTGHWKAGKYIIYSVLYVCSVMWIIDVMLIIDVIIIISNLMECSGSGYHGCTYNGKNKFHVFL